MTGATGLIGSAFVDMLLRADDLDVTVYAEEMKKEPGDDLQNTKTTRDTIS